MHNAFVLDKNGFRPCEVRTMSLTFGSDSKPSLNISFDGKANESFTPNGVATVERILAGKAEISHPMLIVAKKDYRSFASLNKRTRKIVASKKKK